MKHLSFSEMNLPLSTVEALSVSETEVHRSSDKKLAVLIPYRDRRSHLKQLIPILRETLSNQLDDFSITVVEQKNGPFFNKGRLLNAATQIVKGDYFAFHDVDFLPMNVDYRYSNVVMRTFSYTVGHKSYDEPFSEARLQKFLQEVKVGHQRVRSAVHSYIFGGVILIDREQFFQINGYTNRFECWGFEDYDFLLRCFHGGLAPSYDPEGEFELLPHLHSIQMGSHTYSKEEIRGLILENMDLYEKTSKHLIFDDGLSDVSFEVVNSYHAPEYDWLSIAF